VTLEILEHQKGFFYLEVLETELPPW